MAGGGISIGETPTSRRFIPDAPTAITAFIDFFATGPTKVPTPITSFAAFQQTFGGLDPRSEASYQLLQFFSNGGQSAIVYNIAVEPSSPLFVSALESALTSLTLSANLLTLPATANLAPADAHAVMLAAQTFCETNRAFYIADIPPSTAAATPAAIEAWFANTGLAAIDSAALYYPRLTIADPLHPTLSREIASSGTVAGIYARTDSTEGVWTSPAGTGATIANATPVVTLTDLASNELNSLGINPIRTFPGYGTVVWGARTAAGGNAGNSVYKYVSVRRLAIYIESSLQDGLQWSVFEPNNEILWTAIRLAVSAFMLQLWTKGALQGSLPQQSFFVKCDATTTTQNDVDNGRVNIQIGFAPLQPAEFVIVSIAALTASCP
jgi:phage tail sheath protein FI